MVTCYIGVGSNLGDRRKNIKLALKKISQLKGAKVRKVSKFIETEPEGGPVNQGKFLNGCIKISTELAPHVLLNKLKVIEKELGRVKTARNGPRTIDLDILFYADKILNTKTLKIPHPRAFKREFVLKPLLEII